MKNFNNWILLYLKWTSPVAALAATLSALGKSGNTLFYDVIGWTTILWIVSLIYIVFVTALTPQLRNTFVRKLSGIKENDERETQITGLVSKKTFIFMTGILTLLLFLSVIRINIYQSTELASDGKKHGEINFGMGLRFVESGITTAETTSESNRNYLVKYSGLPLTSDGTLIVVMLLQLGAFYFFSRKSDAAT